MDLAVEAVEFVGRKQRWTLVRQFKRYEPRQSSRWINLADDRLDIGEAARIRM